MSDYGRPASDLPNYDLAPMHPALRAAAAPTPQEEEPPALQGAALVKEVCRLIREARKRWDAHQNAGCRRARSQALQLYMTMTEEQKDEVPQVLRVWLRYRSVKYFGPQQRKKNAKRKPPGNG